MTTEHSEYTEKSDSDLKHPPCPYTYSAAS